MNQQVLYRDKLMTLLAEVEAIVNTCPLTCVYKELVQFCFYPLYFLVGSFNMQYPSALKKIIMTLNVFHFGFNTGFTTVLEDTLQQFWKEWTKGYLISLRETLPFIRKGLQFQVHRQPEVCEIVIIKDDDLPCRA